MAVNRSERLRKHGFAEALGGPSARPRRNRMKQASYMLDPSLSREDPSPTYMREFHRSGMTFIAREPRTDMGRLNSDVFGGALILLDGLVSEHTWLKAEPNSEFERTTAEVWRVKARRFYHSGGELVVDTKPRCHPDGTGHNPGYVRRINKKWAKAGATVSEPRSSVIYLMIGRPTCQRVIKTLADASDLFGAHQAAVVIGRVDAGAMPYEFARNLHATKLFRRW